ncbi:DUF1800 family protein [Sphingoaurantiacus capsulatus]|uniref:DUF1800 family protein n=1 Tax=Sphingoaurantiacus capsulatus TaxID=1771310 RepID=A0ABV7XHF0_9SPHN
MRTAIATNRFGLGRRLDDRIDDPRRWLLGQLESYDPRPAVIAALPGGNANAAAYLDLVVARQERRRAAESGMPAEPAPMRGGPRDAYLDQATARLGHALTAPAPFVERLVHFWANHFAVSVDRNIILGLAGNLEFEAIRPHVLGRFCDMLLAVERHPAMLMYLDQVRSVGPDSRAATRAAQPEARQRGLNENLAREILELHTLGVTGGYAQTDVQELAKGLTGWTVAGLRGAGGTPGTVLFRPVVHQPGERTLLGKRYPAAGEAQSRAMLLDLAAHPATARHVATKLARHFVADEPPAALVDRLAKAFQASGGDLPTVYRALIDAPEASAATAPKFKSPWDWTVSSLRALGVREANRRAVRTVAALGQPVWRPGSPAGWGDVTATWAGSDALMRRVEVAQQLAMRLPDIDARALSPRLFDGAVSSTTTAVLAGAESPAQATALLLAAPEFQRR